VTSHDAGARNSWARYRWARNSWVRNCELGSATAEFAVILPAALLIAVALIGVAGQQLRAGALAQKVAVIARAVELGRTDDQLRQLGQSLDIAVSFTHLDGLVCVSGTTQNQMGVMALGLNQARACALRPGS